MHQGNGEYIIEADGSDGAGTATASLTVGEQVIEASLNFSISSRLPYRLNVTLLDAQDEALSVVETGETVIVSVLVAHEDSGEPIASVTGGITCMAQVIHANATLLGL